MSQRWLMLRGDTHIRWLPVFALLAAGMDLSELLHPGIWATIFSRTAAGITSVLGYFGDIAASLGELVRRLSNW